MSHRFPERDPQDGGNQPPQKMLLNKKQVHVGESYSIKGDAQLVHEQEEIVRTIAEKKIRKAEAEALQIIALARQDAETAARTIIQQATEKADAAANALIAEAQAQHDAVLEQARQDGFDSGFNKGYEDAINKVESETVELLETAQTIVNGAYQAEQVVLKNFQEDALELVRHVAEKVIHQQLQQPEVLVEMVHNAVESLYMTGRVKVVLGQKYFEQMRTFTPKTAEMTERLKRFEWTGDLLMTQHEIHILSAEGAYSIGPEDQVTTLLKPLENQLPLAEPVLPAAQRVTQQNPIARPDLEEPLEEEFQLTSSETLTPEAKMVNSLETDPLVLLEEIVGLIPAPDETVDPSVKGAGLIESEMLADNGFERLEPDTLLEANEPVIKPWSLNDLELVQEEYSDEVSEPVPGESLPDAKLVEFPDLESLLTEFNPQLEQESGEDSLS